MAATRANLHTCLGRLGWRSRIVIRILSRLTTPHIKRRAILEKRNVYHIIPTSFPSHLLFFISHFSFSIVPFLLLRLLDYKPYGRVRLTLYTLSTPMHFMQKACYSTLCFFYSPAIDLVSCPSVSMAYTFCCCCGPEITTMFSPRHAMGHGREKIFSVCRKSETALSSLPVVCWPTIKGLDIDLLF